MNLTRLLPFKKREPKKAPLLVEPIPGEEPLNAIEAESIVAEPKQAPGFFRKRAIKTEFRKLPVRVIIGYLPEVSERDALEYAIGLAEKHFDQLGLAFFDAFKFDNGFVFEIHEGGSGRAYVPKIIEYFEATGPYDAENPVSVVLKTGTRRVEVQKARSGLVSVLLPESSTAEPSAQIEATSAMQPALNKRTGFLVVSAALFVTGFAAVMTAAFIARFQPYEAPPERPVEQISAASLPLNQWFRVEAVPPGSYVKALRFRNQRWEAPELGAEVPEAPSDALMPDAAEAPVTAELPEEPLQPPNPEFVP